MTDKLTNSSAGAESSGKTISVPVFYLYHKLLPGKLPSVIAGKSRPAQIKVIKTDSRFTKCRAHLFSKILELSKKNIWHISFMDLANLLYDL